jgi:ketosteroid isomerase-like protein
MSQENVAIVLAYQQAWNAGDMDAIRDLLDAETIFRTPEGWPESGPYIGRDAVMRHLFQGREAWDIDEIERVSDLVHATDRVVVRSIWRGAGRGPEARMEWTTIFTVRNGKIREQEFFWDHAEALEAVGLSQ